MVNEELDDKIVNITPIYDYKKVAGGYFEIEFERSSVFKLSFVPFLDYRVRNDENLFEYLKKTATDLTVSHAIFDLYDMGFPVDEWVRDYIDMAKNSVSADLFNTLINFYTYVKNFNSGSKE